MVNHLSGGEVPRVDLQSAPKIFKAVHRAIRSGWVRSCHDLSEGGLAVAVAEMAFAGEWGVEISLDPLAKSAGIADAGTLLFSESNTRFVMEVPPVYVEEFQANFADLPVVELGCVSEGDRVRILGTSGNFLVDVPWSELKTAWQKPLDWD